MDDHSSTHIVDRLVGMRLHQFQRATGLPVVFGGATAPHGLRRELRIGHVRGAFGNGLVDLSVGAGRGLGGSAIVSGSLRRVHDYASTRAITHDFDGIVVQQEHLSSIFALPIVVGDVVEAVVYGAVRGPQRIGDIVLERATNFGSSLQQELKKLLTPKAKRAEPTTLHHTRAAIAELTELARTTSDGARRSALDRLVAELHDIVGEDLRSETVDTPQHLTPREVDVLRLVAVGMTNSEVAVSLGLTTETVRAYLRSAMRKLGVRNRTEAAHIARRVGAL